MSAQALSRLQALPAQCVAADVADCDRSAVTGVDHHEVAGLDGAPVGPHMLCYYPHPQRNWVTPDALLFDRPLPLCDSMEYWSPVLNPGQ
jgi:hypothetical protein